MLAFILNVYRIKFIKPDKGFRLIISFLKIYYKTFKKKYPIDFQRFINANKISNSDYCNCSTIDANMQLIIVATRKDFEVIDKTISITLKALSNFKSISISMIVPQTDIEIAKNLFVKPNYKISIINEFAVLDEKFLAKLHQMYSSRDTWVYQQALKLNALANCKAEYAMILDADTVLLNARKWICSDGRQMLCPSDEYNFEYYNFLNLIGVSEVVPFFTFVSHHMFYNPKLVQQMLSELDLALPSKQINALNLYSNKSHPSPLCIDFELYGQWLTKNKSDRVRFLKWSNIGISRKHLWLIIDSFFARWILSKLYNSISFHAWS